MIQQSLERSSIRKQKLHSLGWQTMAKLMEREVNSIPLGYLHHETDMGALLRVLSPNCLKLNTSSDRAPAGIFTVPKSSGSLMTKIHDVYRLWYEVWNVEYIPLIVRRQKWYTETENLVENDIIYFKLRDSKLAQNWLIGKVEHVNVSKDGKIRTVGVSYKHDTEDGEQKFSIVERPARECIKLLNIEDTSLLDDIRAVQKSSQELLDEEQVVPQSLLDEITQIQDTDVFENNPNPLMTNDDQDTEKLNKPSKKQRKKKTELEKLKIDDWKPPLNLKRRSGNHSILVNSLSSNFNNNSPIIGLQLFTTTDAENMHDEDDYSCKVEEDVIHQELILNENPVILL